MEKHFVTFYSPGTFISETTVKEIDSWDVDKAVKMADDITERHAATPYGFRFSTRTRKDDELDSKESVTSKMYYLGGTVETLSEVEARNDPKEAILRTNMRVNGWGKIITNTNSWRTTQPFLEGDVLLDYTPKARKQAAK